jgi:hypothetical protein
MQRDFALPSQVNKLGVEPHNSHNQDPVGDSLAAAAVGLWRVVARSLGVLFEFLWASDPHPAGRNSLYTGLM